MRRIGLVLALILTVAALAAEGQQPPKLAKIGMLFPASQVRSPHLVEAFRLGLRELGQIEGRTFTLELRYAEGQSERLRGLARELIGLKVDVIVVSTDAVIAAARRETRTIPLVMAYSADPLGTGFVASFAHPGGNVTGLSAVSPELSGKRRELLRDVVPGLSRVAFLWNPDVRGAVLEYKETEAAARPLRLELLSIEVSNGEDLDRAFSAVTGQRTQALIVEPGNPAVVPKRAEIASFAQRNRLPSMHAAKEYVEAGGLMSYGPSLPAMFRRAATYVDKILKGAKPADLPVEQPTKFELVINLKTAKALGLTIPQSVLLRADEVIQ